MGFNTINQPAALSIMKPEFYTPSSTYRLTIMVGPTLIISQSIMCQPIMSAIGASIAVSRCTFPNPSAVTSLDCAYLTDDKA